MRRVHGQEEKRTSGGPPPASGQASTPTAGTGAPPPSSEEKLIEQRSGRKAAAARAQQQQRERRRNLMLVIGGIAIVAVIAIVLVSNSTRNSSAGVQGSSADTTLGSAGAPVVLQDFSDFYCSHCRTFALERLPALEKKYVDSGLLRVEFKHFPCATARTRRTSPPSALPTRASSGSTATNCSRTRA
ncbi:MAG: thioredoxin domain-containing protein [Anaerolineae bacterium]|nr:MAG: thioredoxin domain-containing protein [Anaerolineae bacterium]